MNSLFTKHLNSSRFKGTPKKNWLASFSQDTIPEAADVWLRNRFWLRQCSGVFNIPSSGRWCFCGRWILKWKNKRCNQRCFFGVLDDMILFWYLDVQSGSYQIADSILSCESAKLAKIKVRWKKPTTWFCHTCTRKIWYLRIMTEGIMISTIFMSPFLLRIA